MKIKTKVLVKRMTAIFLCGVFAVSQPPAAAMAASEMAAPETGAAGEQLLFIQTMEDFQDFQKNCVEDTYSAGLTVSLETDLDLTASLFTQFPFSAGHSRETGTRSAESRQREANPRPECFAFWKRAR